MRRSPEADAILAHAFAQHPTLTPVAEALASDPSMTLDRAEKILALAANKAGLGSLDIEFCQPANTSRVPFGAAPRTGQAGSLQERVAEHWRK